MRIQGKRTTIASEAERLGVFTSSEPKLTQAAKTACDAGFIPADLMEGMVILEKARITLQRLGPEIGRAVELLDGVRFRTIYARDLLDQADEVLEAVITGLVEA